MTMCRSAVLRKIDFMILPVLAFTYGLQFLEWVGSHSDTCTSAERSSSTLQ